MTSQQIDHDPRPKSQACFRVFLGLVQQAVDLCPGQRHGDSCWVSHLWVKHQYSIPRAYHNKKHEQNITKPGSQHVSTCFKMFQDVSRCFKMFQAHLQQFLNCYSSPPSWGIERSCQASSLFMCRLWIRQISSIAPGSSWTQHPSWLGSNVSSQRGDTRNLYAYVYTYYIFTCYATKFNKIAMIINLWYDV